MSETTPDLSAKYLVDPYLNWAKAEGVPIVEGAALDLLTLETKPWARFGVNGAICHVEGRCDFLSVFLFELVQGRRSAPMRHLYEECFYVLEGKGVSEITLSSGAGHQIGWGEGSVFTTPVNATCIHKADGGARVRLVSFNDLRYPLECAKLAELGWVEQESWATGLAKTVAWYKKYSGNWADVESALVAHPLRGWTGKTLVTGRDSAEEPDAVAAILRERVDVAPTRKMTE
jgi:mannose-6-phosphate isomerase-like protein (cupin superfamily)